MTDHTVPGALEAINERLDAGDKRMARLETEVAENTALTRQNTEITREIKELLDAARLGGKMLGGLGTFIRWGGGLAAAGTAIYAFLHLGPK